jgi:ABC-2 type transport system permease protein
VSSTRSLTAADLATRQAPGLGGLNPTVLGLEVRRLLRNRRTVIFAVIAPVVLFLVFGLNKAYANDPDGHGNVSAFIMVSMALYGAVLATTTGGAMVSIERAAGWSRQLRLTPLSPTAYIIMKILTAMVLGLASVVAVFAVGIITGKPSMPVYLWIVSGLCVWIGSLVFAAFGLFLGYLLPTENVMQFLGIGIAILAFAGGLFTPLSQFPHLFRTIAQFTPLYGLNQLVHTPQLGGNVHVAWVANAVVWLILLASGAVWRFRKDTARV